MVERYLPQRSSASAVQKHLFVSPVSSSSSCLQSRLWGSIIRERKTRTFSPKWGDILYWLIPISFQNTIGMLIDGGFTVSIMAPTFDTVGTGVRCQGGGSPWIAIIDAKSINSGVTFVTTIYPSFMIENLSKDTNSDVAQVNGVTVLTGRSHVDTFTYGNHQNPVAASYGAVTSTNVRPQSLAPGGRYPVLPAPSYSDKTVADFINVKDPNQNGGYTVKGDHSIDEAGVLNKVLQFAATNNKIAYFPFGKYRVDSTLLIPKNSRIVGEAWATITGNGDYFKNENSPKPVVAVGNGGDVGTAQIQDMRFTVSDVLPVSCCFVGLSRLLYDPGGLAHCLIFLLTSSRVPSSSNSTWPVHHQVKLHFGTPS